MIGISSLTTPLHVPFSQVYQSVCSLLRFNLVPAVARSWLKLTQGLLTLSAFLISVPLLQTVPSANCSSKHFSASAKMVTGIST